MLKPDYSGQLIRQSEHFVQSALDALSAHIAILDEDGTIIGVNDAWRNFADSNNLRNPNYGIGTNYLQTCDTASGRNSKEGPLVSQGIRDVIENKIREFRLEYPCHSKKEKRWFVMHTTRFMWDGHMRVIVAHQNVTELKSVQVELFQSQNRIQTILDNVINGIVTLDSNGTIESINPAGAGIFGYEMQDIIGHSVRDLLAEREYPNNMRGFLQQLQTANDREWVGVRQDGEEFPLYFVISRVILGNRRVYTGILQDNTERRQVEAERLEKERLKIELEKERDLRTLKSRFISMMSHELRTPLASIRLSSDLLARYGDKAPPEEKQLYMDNITSQVELLTDLIRDVSTISRGEVKSATVMPERTDIVSYCRELADEFRLTHHETHTIIFSSQRNTIHAMVDQKLMRQVFSNLISNALKYSPHGGDLIIYVGNGGRNATIRITDHGIGIPLEDLRSLFEPFHRGANVDNLPGTGLGLAIAKQAIELHGGSIKVESEVNIGTSVTVSLPIHLVQ